MSSILSFSSFLILVFFSFATKLFYSFIVSVLILRLKM